MATDPVRSIEEHRHETPFVDDLPAALNRLAALPPSLAAPYLTLTLDLRPEGGRPNTRPGRGYFDQNGEEFLAAFQPHTPPHDSLGADLERIKTYLDGELDPAVQGLAVVACSAHDVFEPLPLGLPLPNRFATAPTPLLRTLAQLAEDQSSYVVLLADQREATLSLVTHAQPEQSTAVETNSSGGQRFGSAARRRDHHRRDERIEAFARALADETQRVMDESGATMLVLAGDESITTTLRGALHQTVRDRVVGSVPLDVHAGERDLVAASRPLVEQAEREREAAAVAAVRDGAGPGGIAVTAAVDTLTALQTGQVLTLVMNDDFAAPGWADYSFPLLGAGEVPSAHPAAGDIANIVPIALEEELVRLALHTGANIEIVRTAVPVGIEEQAHVPDADGTIPRAAAATDLDALGGVGATLRYTLDTRQSTAEL